MVIRIFLFSSLNFKLYGELSISDVNYTQIRAFNKHFAPQSIWEFFQVSGIFFCFKIVKLISLVGTIWIKWAAIGCLMFMQPLAHNNTIHTTKLWLMMPPKLQLISLPPYNLSPTRVKRFTYVDKTTFVSKKTIVNTWI
jgi:hypothetical protein